MVMKSNQLFTSNFRTYITRSPLDVFLADCPTYAISWTALLEMVLEMDYRVLTRLFSCVARRPPVQQVSKFLDLPLDIIYIIFNELPLSSKILLSQTCRALWYEMHERSFMALRKTTTNQRLNVLTELGRYLPDQYLCAMCNVLHRIEYTDFPANDDMLIVKSIIVKSNRRCSWPEHWGNTYSFGFINTAFRHVNLATKYTRMNTSPQYYCERLLQKYELDYHPQIGIKYIVEPRVVLNRYILMVTCIFSAGPKPYCFESLCRALVLVCPHSVLYRAGETVKNPFVRVLRQAFHSLRDQQDPRPRFFSCDHCPTDISILVEKDKARIVCWADLGTGESSEDPFWQSHVCRDISNSPFKYKHGSVRELYTSYPT